MRPLKLRDGGQFGNSKMGFTGTILFNPLNMKFLKNVFKA